MVYQLTDKVMTTPPPQIVCQQDGKELQKHVFVAEITL